MDQHWIEKLKVGDKVIISCHYGELDLVGRVRAVKKKTLDVEHDGAYWRFYRSTGAKLGEGESLQTMLTPWSPEIEVQMALEDLHYALENFFYDFDFHTLPLRECLVLLAMFQIPIHGKRTYDA